MCSASANGRTCPLSDGLLDHLRNEELLILLDNCEHLASACGELVQEVLRACPGSRAGNEPGPARTRRARSTTPSIPCPTPTDDSLPTRSARFASVRLFVERGARSTARRRCTANDLTTVARICRELDGLPLAIELAAARAKALSVDEIADRLDDRFRFLRSWRQRGRRRATRRSGRRSTGATSCSRSRRARAARALSVFAGGFTLDAVAAICLDGDRAQARRARRPAGRVVARRRRGRGRARRGTGCWRRSASTRPSGSTHRSSRDGPPRPRRVLPRGREGERTRPTTSRGQAGGVSSSSTRSATTCTRRCAGRLRTGSDLALPLAPRLWRYWLIRGYRRQGLDWLEQALACRRLPPLADSRRALSGAALLARLMGDFTRAAEPLAREAVALGRSVGPPFALRRLRSTCSPQLSGARRRLQPRPQAIVTSQKSGQSLALRGTCGWNHSRSSFSRRAASTTGVRGRP